MYLISGEAEKCYSFNADIKSSISPFQTTSDHDISLASTWLIYYESFILLCTEQKADFVKTDFFCLSDIS